MTFPGLEITIYKFHDFSRFSLTVRTLSSPSFWSLLTPEVNIGLFIGYILSAGFFCWVKRNRERVVKVKQRPRWGTRDPQHGRAAWPCSPCSLAFPRNQKFLDFQWGPALLLYLATLRDLRLHGNLSFCWALQEDHEFPSSPAHQANP